VFVGYGIVDTAADMDDYAGIDVNNCIVLFRRGNRIIQGTITHADKVRIARQKGAVGYLTATGPVLSSYELRRGVTGPTSAFYGLSPAPDNLPGAWISTHSGANHCCADHSNQDTSELAGFSSPSPETAPLSRNTSGPRLESRQEQGH